MEITLKNQGLISASTTFDFSHRKSKSANHFLSYVPPPLLLNQK